MKIQKRKPSGREKDQAAVKLLGQLREKLYSNDASTRRVAAFNLSWMQDDGLDILTEALFGNSHRSTKSAAAYGLRNMGGRMKKMALEVFKQGLKRRDSGTREACRRALSKLSPKEEQKPAPKKAERAGKFEIKEIARKRGLKGKVPRKRLKRTSLPDKGLSRR